MIESSPRRIRTSQPTEWSTRNFDVKNVWYQESFKISSKNCNPQCSHSPTLWFPAPPPPCNPQNPQIPNLPTASTLNLAPKRWAPKCPGAEKVDAESVAPKRPAFSYKCRLTPIDGYHWRKIERLLQFGSDSDSNARAHSVIIWSDGLIILVASITGWSWIPYWFT
jgi:hypothetical protein